MEILAVVALVVLAIIVLANRGGKNSANSPASSGGSKAQRILDENLPWLTERWERAFQERAAGEELSQVREWFFDDATDRQLDRLADDGFRLGKLRPTKGQASDIIGLLEDMEPEDREVLTHFKIPLKGMNQTKARHTIAMLFKDPANVESWRTRPASALQKGFYRTLGWKVPKGLTSNEAAAAIDADHEDEWLAFADLYEELIAPETRENYEIGKVSIKLFCEAWAGLRADGIAAEDLEDDIDTILERLIELKPDLER